MEKLKKFSQFSITLNIVWKQNFNTMAHESNEEMERKYTDLFRKLDRGADGEQTIGQEESFTLLTVRENYFFSGRIDINDLTAELREQGMSESYAQVSRHLSLV